MKSAYGGKPGMWFFGAPKMCIDCPLLSLVRELGHCGHRALLKALGLDRGETEARGSCAS